MPLPSVMLHLCCHRYHFNLESLIEDSVEKDKILTPPKKTYILAPSTDICIITPAN